MLIIDNNWAIRLHFLWMIKTFQTLSPFLLKPCWRHDLGNCHQHISTKKTLINLNITYQVIREAFRFAQSTTAINSFYDEDSDALHFRPLKNLILRLLKILSRFLQNSKMSQCFNNSSEGCFTGVFSSIPICLLS